MGASWTASNLPSSYDQWYHSIHGPLLLGKLKLQIKMSFYILNVSTQNLKESKTAQFIEYKWLCRVNQERQEVENLLISKKSQVKKNNSDFQDSSALKI